MTYDDILTLAFGDMELLPSDFYEMSWREFFLLVRGKQKKREKDFIKLATLTREISYQVYCSIPFAKGKRHMSKKKYWELPFDKESDDKDTQALIGAMEKLKQKNGTGN